VSAPLFFKAFHPSQPEVGDTLTMNLKISNVENTTGLTGVAFTDNLPAGLEVAATPSLLNSCGGTVSGAVPGSTVVSLTGGTVGAGQGCDVAMRVTVTAAGEITNTAGPVTSNEAPPSATASATLTVNAPYNLAPAVEQLSSTGRTVGFSLASASTVRFSLDRRITRNRFRRVGTFSTRARRGRNRVRVPRRLNGRRVGKGVFRLSARAVTGGGRGALTRRVVRLR
jgi:uncharacterized repeat protein (TIGR01451 family)